MLIDHIGIATSDAAEITETYCELFGASVVHEETIEDLNVWFLELENGCFELLEPTEEEEIITGFLDNHGPGLHHVGIGTPDVRSALEGAMSNGVECIDESPRPGARGQSVAFLHPKSTGGVLIEFVEHPKNES